MRPMRSPRIAAIGRQQHRRALDRKPRVGQAGIRSPNLTSGNSRSTCRKASAMPVMSTPNDERIEAGMARNATQICLESTTTMRAHRIRNTTIRTRKIRGDESLSGSRSFRHGVRPPSVLSLTIWHRRGETK